LKQTWNVNEKIVTMSKVTVILPTYNEKGNIGRVIDQLQAEFTRVKQHQMDILVVDDNSPDGTQDEVKQAMRRHKHVHLITGTKQGLGKAYIRGMDYAIEKLGADVVFEMDADMSHDPREIHKFLQKIDAGYDLVVGSRYIQGGSIPSNWGIHRKIFSVTGNLIVRSILLNFSQHEWTNGYRAIRTSLYQQLRPELIEFTGYTFQVSFLHKAILLGAKITEIPIQFTDRTLGKSKIPAAEYITNLLKYLLIQTFTHPPRVFRFIIVGGVGAAIQLFSLQVYRQFSVFQLAFFFSIETAIVSNFILSNIWTFADRKLSATQIPIKFIQFNLASAGSILIQQLVALIGENTIGLKPLYVIDTGTMFAVVGILIGMFWNFFAYSKFIWRHK